LHVAAPLYKRVILKLSGEVLGASAGSSVDTAFMAAVLRQVKEVVGLGASVGIVVGGGNILRGCESGDSGLTRVTADHIGMLGTVINGLALRDVGRREHLEVVVMSPVSVGTLVTAYNPDLAAEHLASGKVVVFVGGTGSPFFTTDTAAAIRAAETGADALLKATKVDGVYTADPMVDSSATRFKRLSFRQALDMRLSFMDRAALSLCEDRGIPVVVFNVHEKDSIKRVVLGEQIGTLVEGGVA
jgi:uridylate kinase